VLGLLLRNMQDYTDMLHVEREQNIIVEKSNVRESHSEGSIHEHENVHNILTIN